MTKRTFASMAARLLPVLLSWPLLTALSGCGCGDDTDSSVKDLITISEGIYGQGIVHGDACSAACGCPANYAEGESLAVFAGVVESYATVTDTPLGAATSGKRGFYEMALTPGTVTLCDAYAQEGTTPLQYDLRECIDASWSQGRLRVDFSRGMAGTTFERVD